MPPALSTSRKNSRKKNSSSTTEQQTWQPFQRNTKQVFTAKKDIQIKAIREIEYQNIENKPDLIIMDGGETQVNSCISALKDINRDIKVLGLVKDDNHKTRALYYDGKEFEIDKRSYAFKLLEYAQEEVHRYAITYFRSKHLKDTFTSKLQSIEGIGKVKSEKILIALREVNALEIIEKINLTKEQLKQVKEICSLTGKEE